MGPMTLTAIVAGTIAVSSDFLTSAITFKFMEYWNNRHYEHPKQDPLKSLLKRRGSYEKFMGKS